MGLLKKIFGGKKARPLGLVVVGNALVDVLAHADESFIADQAQAHGMKKGTMNLIDAARGKDIYAAMNPATEMSGGSGANSLAAFASFGGKGGFIGKVADDEFGEIFTNDLKSQGIAYSTPVYDGDDGLETGRSYILVTPEGQRTMNTYLGASTALGMGDIDGEMIAGADILLLEGYLFDKLSAKRAFMKAAQYARIAGTKVAFTLSDRKCVARHHEHFALFVDTYVDILIGNEEEIKAFTLKDTFEDAIRVAANFCETLVVTRGKDGATIVDNKIIYNIPAVKPEKIEDTTGAGDAFAGGVLYGLSKGMAPDRAGLLGAKAASKTISHMGARSPDVKFSELLPT